MRSRGIVYLLVVGFALLAVWTVVIPGFVQWRLEAALYQVLPAERIKVGVRGRPEAIMRGQIPWLTVDVRRARVDALPIEALTAEFSQVELDSARLFGGGQLTVRRIGAGRASLVLTEEGLRRYLEQAQGVRSVRVRLADGVMTLEAMIPLLQQEFRATMQGRFVILDGRRVILRVENLSVSGVTLPSEIANILLAPLNPLLSVEQLPFPLRLQTVAIENGQLTLTAEAAS